MRLMVRATTNPERAPMNRVGPKVPPTPPPAFVKDIEKTFSMRTTRKKSGTAQG